MSFMILKNAVTEQMKEMEKHGLFVTDVDKDDLWDTYLNSFPPGSNPMFRKRTEHDCSCCRQFIKACGNMVAIIDGEMVSIWDIDVNKSYQEEGGAYQEVADAMSALVKSKKIKSKFLYFQKKIGTNHNLEKVDDQILEWNHFYHELEDQYVMKNILIDRKIGEHRTSVQTFKRALEEITVDAIETVLDLIAQKSLYKGDEYDRMITLFLSHKLIYINLDDLAKEIYAWTTDAPSSIAGIRNTSIGTLLVDLSNDIDINTAVLKYRKKVDPLNYKRSSAPITKGMIDKAQQKAIELGVDKSFPRRYAHVDDIDVTNVIYVNRDYKMMMGVFDDMKSDIPVNVKNLDKVEEVSIDAFIKDILPKSKSIEMMLDNKHSGNLVSLIAPINTESVQIFKWNNNFSWSYNGNVTDSMRERVKKAGGSVEGVLRFSIQWNDGEANGNDFDAHCVEPNGNVIYYPNSGRVHNTSGILDVDIIHPTKNVPAVENITWSDIDKMLEGKYQFIVHNYSGRTSPNGFTAEIEYDGVIHSFSYDKKLRGSEKVSVADVTFNKRNGIKIIKSLKSTQASKELWGINTQQFHNVSMVMLSPNHWDGKSIGNKHWFFMLEGCNNEEKSRGFYNEFLRDDLMEYRKVFEVLGDKLKTDVSDNQLSGLGFSSTKRDSVLCKISGSFNRVVRINF